MKLSRISVVNFRNFDDLDVRIDGDVVVVGENRVGKSNLIHALRLIFDATLPDSARQLHRADFWDGLGIPGPNDWIEVAVEIVDFESDPDVLCLLTDFRLDKDPDVVRLNYVFRPKASLTEDPASDDDYEFVCFGGESETKRYGHDLRRRLAMDLLPALRDAEGDVASWGRSPLRPLVERAFSSVDAASLEPIRSAIEAATGELREFDTVKDLEGALRALYCEMSGSSQDVKPTLGFGATDISRLYRNVRLLIDDGRRSIAEASLGSANIVFLVLKTLDLRRQIEENRRDHTLLAIEEPEAHLHPHLQRSVYRHLFAGTGMRDGGKPMSVVLTTHSPHVASIAPLRSLVLLRDTAQAGTVARSTASARLTRAEEEDLGRYLDVTRAELLFARGVVLVEGDAEKFVIPVFARTLGLPLDQLGITVCSVGGTNFKPYVKFLTALGIPHAVVTDWDPIVGRRPLGARRTARLAVVGERVRTGRRERRLSTELDGFIEDENWVSLSERCASLGVFTNIHTLEVDLFKSGFADELIETLREHRFGGTRRAWIEQWSNDHRSLRVDRFLAMIEVVGKGRFAQRLASRILGRPPPAYIRDALNFVASRA